MTENGFLKWKHYLWKKETVFTIFWKKILLTNMLLERKRAGQLFAWQKMHLKASG